MPLCCLEISGFFSLFFWVAPNLGLNSLGGTNCWQDVEREGGRWRGGEGDRGCSKVTSVVVVVVVIAVVVVFCFW